MIWNKCEWRLIELYWVKKKREEKKCETETKTKKKERERARGRCANSSINWESDSNENNWIKCHNQEIICIAYGFFIESNEIHLCHELVFNASLDGVCVRVVLGLFFSSSLLLIHLCLRRPLFLFLSVSVFNLFSYCWSLFLLLSLSTVLCALFSLELKIAGVYFFSSFFCFIQLVFFRVCIFICLYMIYYTVEIGYIASIFNAQWFSYLSRNLDHQANKNIQNVYVSFYCWFLCWTWHGQTNTQHTQNTDIILFSTRYVDGFRINVVTLFLAW